MRLIGPVFVLCFVNISLYSQVTRYWIGSASTKNWNNTLNWSSSSGGAVGASVPGTNDRVVFNNLGNINCIVDISGLMVESISISGYSAIIDLSGNNFSVSGATNGSAINAPAGGLTITSSSGSPSLSIAGNNDFTFSGTGNSIFNNVSINILLGGTATCTVSNAVFGGSVNFKAPHVLLNGATYNGTTVLEKSDAVGQFDDYGAGGNTFSGTTTITNSSRKYLATATSAGDVFNGTVNLISSGTSASLIYLSHSHPSTFNGNITVACTGTGGGIDFGEYAGGISTISSGKSISVGGSGFSSGALFLGGMRYPDALNLTLTGTALLCFGPAYSYGEPSTFSSAVTGSSPRLTLNMSTFNGALSVTKTGTTDDFSLGGNTFQALTQIINSSNAAFCFAADPLGQPDTFNGDLSLTSNGTSSTSYIYMAHTIGGSYFNGNITVSCSGSGAGIYFGLNSTGTSFLASGKTISAGTFSAGRLRLNRFTQLGSTAQSITLTGTGQIDFGAQSAFNGKVTAVAPTITFTSTTFNGDVDITSPNFSTFTSSSFNGSLSVLTKSVSATNNTLAGGNTFGDSASDSILFVNKGTGFVRFANTTGDSFKGKTGFDSNTGSIQPAYNVTSTFESNITVKGNAITFGTGTGSVSFSGTNNQYIYKSGSNNPTFTKFSLDKTSGIVYLKTKLTISTSGTFNSGVMITDNTNLLVFNNGAVASSAKDASHVNGPVQKIGTQTFDFPIGNGSYYRPIGLASVAGTSNTFTAEYFKLAPSNSSNLAGTINHISRCEYWSLVRTSGTANVTIKPSWNPLICDAVGSYVDDLTKLRVAGYEGSLWQDLGNASTSGNNSLGTITSSSAPTVYGSFTLASTDAVLNPLPIELSEFWCNTTAAGIKLDWTTQSESNNDRFEILRSFDGTLFTKIGEVKGSGTSADLHQYSFLDEHMVSNRVYYRLKQIDLDGAYTYSKIIAFISQKESGKFLAFPNPSSGIVYLNKSCSGIVFNSTGVIAAKFTSKSELDFNEIVEGEYFIVNDLGEITRVTIY